MTCVVRKIACAEVGITLDVVAQYTWKANTLCSSSPRLFPVIKIINLY